MGATMAWRGAQRGVEKIREHRSTDVRSETIDGDYIVPSDAPETADYFPPAREWRVWSGDTDDPTPPNETSLHWGTTPKQKTG